MTTPKLHNAAVKAAEKWSPVRSMSDLAQIIHAAIDDHLKSEGWVELREAADRYIRELDNPAPDYTMRMVHRREIREALRRVRGEKP